MAAPVLTHIPAIEAVLHTHADAIGADSTGYRNHVYRVANLCLAQCGTGGDTVEKVAIAAVCHDIGIWTDGTFDYLEPSMGVAAAHLRQADRMDWADEIAAMIREHHKITPYRGRADWLVEPFRRADWVDVSKGLLTFGLPRAAIREVSSAWPSAGFHRRLVQFELQRLRTHPLNPLPMLKW